MSEWITFEERGWSKSGKTKIWYVRANDGGAILGGVSWFSQWRKYAFGPSIGTVFEPTCLRDIADFCETATKAHKETQK